MKQKRGIRVIVGTLLSILVIGQAAFLWSPPVLAAGGDPGTVCKNNDPNISSVTVTNPTESADKTQVQVTETVSDSSDQLTAELFFSFPTDTVSAGAWTSVGSAILPGSNPATATDNIPLPAGYAGVVNFYLAASSGGQVNKCSSVGSFTSTAGSSAVPPCPTGVFVAAPINQTAGSSNGQESLAFYWGWPSVFSDTSKIQSWNFQMVYTTPAGASTQGLAYTGSTTPPSGMNPSSPPAGNLVYESSASQPVQFANTTGANTVTIVAVGQDNKTISTGCKPITVTFDSTGQFAGATLQDGSSETPLQLEAAAGATTKGACGDSAGVTEIVKAIGQGICGLVITISQFNASLVAAAGNVLAAMLNLPGGGNTTGGLGNLAAYIPAAIQPQGILDNLNAVPFVADTIILVDRILGFMIIFALLVVALANILQININIYAIKKAVPALVLGYVLALSAPFATKVCIEFSNYLAAVVMSPKLNGNTTVNVSTLVTQMSYVHSTSGTGGDPSQLNFADSNGDGGVNMAAVFQQIILNTVTAIAAILMFVLAILLVVRALIFIVLLPLAPVAFFGITFEPLNSFWKKWWKTTESWLFMNTVAAFWLWLMFKLITIGNANTAGGTAGATATSSATVLLSGIVAYVAGIVCLWLAVTTPFKMAGEAKAIFSKAEKLVNAGKDKALAAPGKYLKDEASMRLGRNQMYQAAKSKINNLAEERKKNVEYGQKGMNYKSIKKDAEKLSDLSKKENELKTIQKAEADRTKDIADGQRDLNNARAKLTIAQNSGAPADVIRRYQEEVDKYDKIVAKASTELLELESREDETRQQIKKGEGSLTKGTRSNRKQISREMFHHKHEEIFKEQEEVLNKSTQARVAQNSNAYKHLDGEKRDLSSAKDHVGYLAKSELDTAYREGFDGHENSRDLKQERQFNSARLEAVKKMDEDHADEDKMNSAVEYLYALKDSNGDVQSLTEEEKEIAKKQGRIISSGVEEDAKKDKGYGSGENVQAALINGADIPRDVRKDALDGVTSLSRAYYDITTNVNLENKPKMKDALSHLMGKVTDPRHKLQIKSVLDELEHASSVNEIKNANASFKSSPIGKRLKEIYKDPHEAMLNAKLKEL